MSAASTQVVRGGRGWVVGDGSDPLHQDCDAPIRWTTVNLAEAFPGVPTPLTWTVIGPSFEAMARGGWVMIGAIPRAAAGIPARVEDRYITIFHARPVFSLDRYRAIGDAMPGTSGDAVETQIFGAKLSTAQPAPSRRRYPVVALKMPLAARRSRRAMLALAAETDTWWRRSVTGTRSRSELLALLLEAQERILRIGPHHTVLSMLAFASYQQVSQLAAAAGFDGLETSVLGSDGAEEAKTVADLWALSRDQLSLAQFLDRHGFHGPAEGELATASWRQDDTPVQSLVSTYRKLADDASPATGRAERLAVRDAAQTQLLGALGPSRRARARVLLAMARKYMPLRELGRGTFLKAIDVARYAARELGSVLVREGQLADPADVFYLCPHELQQPPPDLPALVALRRQRREQYARLELPDIFTGSPTPTTIDTDAGDTGDGTVSGLGVSSGVVEGRVRVVLELGDDELEADEILVCRTTDPGWASYFFVAGGVVIDVGGPISHGAIVARELGIPCVINTRNGTQRLHTGDLVRVDGTAGSVTPI